MIDRRNTAISCFMELLALFLSSFVLVIVFSVFTQFLWVTVRFVKESFEVVTFLKF